MRWDAIYFDLDNTLFSHESAFKKSICFCLDMLFKQNQITNRINSETVFAIFKKNCDRYWDDYEKGYITSKEYRRVRFLKTMECLGLNYPINVADDFHECYYEIVDDFSEVYPGVPKMLDQLLNKHISLGIITNGSTSTQISKIKKMKLDKWFSSNTIYISQAINVAKPDKQIFDIAKKNLEARESFLFIGDSWEHDVIGAIEAGWEAVYLNTRAQAPTTDHKPFAICNTITELTSVIL